MNWSFLFLIICLARASHALAQADSPEASTIEYRVQYQDWSPLEKAEKLLDLRCTHLKTPIANETVYDLMNQHRRVIFGSTSSALLFQKTHFPFKWVPASNVTLRDSNLLIAGHDNTGEPIFICRKEHQIGMVTPLNKECQLYSNGSITSESNYTVLINSGAIPVRWAPVSTWSEIPEAAAFVLSRPSLTERKLIVRTVYPKIGPIITHLRQNVDFKVNQEVPIASSLELGNRTAYQVLVEGSAVDSLESGQKEESPEYYLDWEFKSVKMGRLACQAAKEELNLRAFTREDHYSWEKFDMNGERSFFTGWTLYKKVANSTLA